MATEMAAVATEMAAAATEMAVTALIQEEIKQISILLIQLPMLGN